MKSRKVSGAVLLIRASSFSASKFTLELYQSKEAQGLLPAPRCCFLPYVSCLIFPGIARILRAASHRSSWDRTHLACSFSTGIPGIAGLLRAVSQPVFLGSQGL